MLRHKVRFGGFEAVDRSVEKRDVVPQFKPPLKFEFAREGDVKALVDLVGKSRQVDVIAAVGAGKSTRIPMLLARARACLVVHTIPFHIAARYLADYLTNSQDGKVVYMDDLEADFPPDGVVLTTNAYLHARLAKDGLRTMKRTALLYMDEVHESDAPTAVLRTVGPALKKFDCVVRATASSGPAAMPPPRLPGTCRTERYRATPPESWSAYDRGAPWAATSIDGNALICMDRPEVRDRLRQEYTDAGFDVRVCTHLTDYDYFAETVRRLRDPNSGIVVVLCDYAYRSSFSIPGLSILIDSCEVGLASVEKGAPVHVYRDAFEFEIQQFLGRGGRIPGETVVKWRSADTALQMMCDVEKLERHAANILFRLLGYRPPLSFVSVDFYEGDVPADLAAAMASDHPLVLCPPESRVPWVNGDRGYMLQEDRAAYAYELEKTQKRTKFASVHTVPDTPIERTVTPPPAVPPIHRVTRVPSQALREHRERRDSFESQASSDLFITRSEVPDNLTVYAPDAEEPAFAKPKRIAKHRMAAMKAEEEERQRLAALAESEVASVSSEAESVVVPRSERAVQPDLDKPLPVVSRGDVRRFASIIDPKLTREAILGAGVLDKAREAIPDDKLGLYVYYHGMRDAPDQSMWFPKGIESVIHERDNMATFAKGLPDTERMYAMRKLVDEYNNSVAIVLGMQRLFDELRGRPPDTWEGIVDHYAMDKSLTWMFEQVTTARSRSVVCAKYMIYYMDYGVEYIPAALDLEQRIMTECMQRFESELKLKDSSDVTSYLRQLGSRQVLLGSTRSMRAIRD